MATSAPRKPPLSPELEAWHQRTQAGKRERLRAAQARGALLSPQQHAAIAVPDVEPAPVADRQPEPSTPKRPPAAPPPSPARGGGGGPRPVSALGGVIVGLFAWGYALNWLRGGMSQANSWAAAKFLNKTTAAAGTGAGPRPQPIKAVPGQDPLPAATTRRAPA